MTVQDAILGRSVERAPVPSQSNMSMQELMNRAAEVTLLRRDIETLQRQMLNASMEVMHWRRFALDKGLITEADYDRISQGI
jgi:hypothetical protein